MDIKERFYANLNLIREETEQMDEVADGKLFRKSAKMIKTSNLDQNRKRNKNNRQD